MKTNRFTRLAVLSGAAMVALSGFISCTEKKTETEEPPVVLDNQIELNGGTPVDIKSAIYEVTDTDLYTFYLSPTAGVTTVIGTLEADDYMLVSVRAPQGTVEVEDEFEIRYDDISVSGGATNMFEAFSLSVDLDGTASVLDLTLDATLASGETLRADYGSACPAAALVELENEYELDDAIYAIGSAVAVKNRAEGTTTYHFYTEDGVTAVAEDKTPALTVVLPMGLESTENIDLAAAEGVSLVCGDFSNEAGAVTGTLSLSVVERSGMEILVLSVNAAEGDRTFRAEFEKRYSYTYVAANKFKVTPAGQDPVEAALPTVFFYDNPAASNVFMLGTAEQPASPADLMAGYAVKMAVSDMSIDSEIPVTSCAFNLYDYQTYTTLTAGEGVTGTVVTDHVDGDLYLYFTVTFADGTVAEAEWFGAATAAEENTDLTPVEPVKPKITISSPDGSIVFEAELDRVEMRMEKNYKLRGGDPQYGGATFDAYFFYFVPVDTEISWQGVEGDRANVPMFMFPVANVPSEDLSLATAPEGLNWSMKYSKSGIQIPEYSNTYTMYGTTSGYCPEDAKATVVRNDDKTWNLSFSTTDFVNTNYGGSGSKNLLLIQWQGPLTKYSGTKTNDYPEADY